MVIVMIAQPVIYFIRHGETAWNLSQRVQGQMDIDINDTGKAQADRNGDELRAMLGSAEGYDFVASPLRRTRETMERIRTRMGLDPLDYVTDDRLMEVNFGDWEGLMMEDLIRVQQEVITERGQNKWNFIPPGEDAESYLMLSGRVKSWLDGVTNKTVCVTHGGCIRTLFYTIGKMSGHEAAMLAIPQDRILRLENNKLEWF